MSQDGGDAMAELAASMVAAGMVLAESRRSGAFDEWYEIYTGDVVEVALVSERGGKWVDISRQGWGDRFDAELWRTVLDGPQYAEQSMTTAEQCQFVGERLADVRHLVTARDGDALRKRLIGLRRDRFMRSNLGRAAEAHGWKLPDV